MAKHTIYIRDEKMFREFMAWCKDHSVPYSQAIEAAMRIYMDRLRVPVHDRD